MTQNIFSYDRVSSDEQAREGINLGIKREKYLKIGIPKDNMYSDAGISGGFSEIEEVKIQITETEFIARFPINKRKNFNQLIQRLKITPDSKLVFSSYDRISRSSSFGDLFFIWLKQKGIEWQALEDIDTHESSAMRRFLFAWANDRRDNDATNTDRQKHNLYEQGKYSSKNPYGYYRDKEGVLVINEKEAEIVRQIYQLYAEGKTKQEISKIVDKHPQLINNILHNEVYKGYVSYKKEKKKGIHKAIVSEEEWLKANSKHLDV